jgi:ATP/maltotriose-dependent transcriptional regulator MalT
METTGNKMGRAFYLSNIASTYDVQRNYVKAMDYYNQSLSLKIELGDSAAFASIYHNLGILSFNLNDLELSNSYFIQSLEISRKLGSSEKIVRTLSNLGRNNIERNEYTQAEQILLEAYSISKNDVSIGENNRADLLLNLGLLYEKMSDYDKAFKYNEDAIKLALSTGATEIIRNAYLNRSILEERVGRTDIALSFERLATLYTDSLINEGTINAVAEMEAKYEYHKNKQLIQQGELEIVKEKQISAEATLTRNNWIISGLIIGFICLILSVKYINKRKHAGLMSAQNELIKLRNGELDGIIVRMNSELEKLQITVNTKQIILDKVFSERQSKALPSELLTLSKREMEVLAVLALGWSDQEISNGLFISKTTTKTHLRRIYSKLLVKGRTEAVSLAHRHGIIGIERTPIPS